MRRHKSAVLVLGALALPTAAYAGHSDLTVPPADTFLLGGDQGAVMTVSGKNVGQTDVEIRSRSGTADTVITRVAPGGTFSHAFAVGETALIANGSTTQAARLSVDFSGSSASLSMRYALPQKD